MEGPEVVDDPAGVRRLVALIHGDRERPVVLVTIAGGRVDPLIDAERIHAEVEGLADVYVMKTGPLSRAFADLMPDRTQVFGGAGRVYPVGDEWTRNERLSPLRFARDEGQAARATQALIRDATEMALGSVRRLGWSVESLADALELARTDRPRWLRAVRLDRVATLVVDAAVTSLLSGDADSAEVVGLIVDAVSVPDVDEQLRRCLSLVRIVGRATSAPPERAEVLVRVTSALLEAGEQDPERRAGWAGLVATTAQQVWRSLAGVEGPARNERSGLAIELAERAYVMAGELRSGTESARVRAFAAMTDLQVRGSDHFRLHDHPEVQRAVSRLRQAARELEDSYAGEADIRRLRLRCGVQLCDSLARHARNQRMGWLDAHRAAFDDLVSGMRWWIEVASEPAATDNISDILRAVAQAAGHQDATFLANCVLSLTNLAPAIGRADVADEAIATLEAFELDAFESSRLWLGVADQHPVLRDRVNAIETFIRMAHHGAFDAMPYRSRRSVVSRFRNVANRIAGPLHRNEQTTTAFFLKWEIARVADRLSVRLPTGDGAVTYSLDPAVLGPALENDDPVADDLVDQADEPDPDDTAIDDQMADERDAVAAEPEVELPARPEGRRIDRGASSTAVPPAPKPRHPGPADGTSERVSKDLGLIRQAVQRQNPLQFVLGLRGLGSVSEETWSQAGAALREVLSLLLDWRDLHLPGDGPTTLRDEPVVERDEFRSVVLRLADDAASQAAVERRPQILFNLASIGSLPRQFRIESAMQSYRLARDMERFAQEARALNLLLPLLAEAGEAARIRELVDEHEVHFLELLRRSVAGVGLYELVASSSAHLERLATLLAEVCYPEQAFRIARLAGGWISQALASDPSLIEDLALLSGGGEKNWVRLYQRIEERLVDARLRVPIDVDVPDLAVPAGTAHVLYIRREGPDEQMWALVAVGRGDGTAVHAVRIATRAQELTDLVRRAWLELRPSRIHSASTSRSTRALSRIHERLVAPWREVVEEGGEIVFGLSRAVARVPLHAARGVDGFLLERNPCRYEAHRWQGTALSGTGGVALVGGWNAEIAALEEVDDVSVMLAQLGYDVVRPTTAASGRAAVLDPTRTFAFLHLVGHGRVEDGQDADSAEIELERLMSITARDWTLSGCLAGFAFLNVCSVGGAETRAGDLTGFPLALRVRGGQASVTALGDVEHAASHAFARRFYRGLLEADAFAAYLAAVRDSIGAGVHPSGWAPYAYEGTVAPRLSVPPDFDADLRAPARLEG